jgi:hypothetical protein
MFINGKEHRFNVEFDCWIHKKTTEENIEIPSGDAYIWAQYVYEHFMEVSNVQNNCKA